MATAATSELDTFRERAETAEKKLKALQERLNKLESKLDDDESKQSLVLGAPSSMNDGFQLNLRHLMDRGVRTQADTEIVTRISGGKYSKMTYREAQQRAKRIACSLQKLGISVGDRIGTFMWNNGRHMTLYYAVPSMGAVLHTLNIRLAPHELSYIIGHAADRVLFVDASLLPLLQNDKNKELQDTLSKLEHIIICGDDESPGKWTSTLPNTMDFDDFIKIGDSVLSQFAWPELDERSGAALCYTSGTTGDPKGVMYSHRSCTLHSLVMMGTDIMTVSGADSVLPVVPMFHALAWCTPFVAFAIGFKYVLYSRFRAPTDFLEMVDDHQVTLLLGVPTILNAVKMAMQKEEIALKFGAKIKACWDRAVCGGSAPSPSMIKWYHDELGVEVIHGWGMTETNPVGSIARRVCRRADLTKTEEQLHANQVVQGVVAPLVQMKIVRPDNYEEELPMDGKAMGELLVRGPTVCNKYYGVDAKHKFFGGWLLTGDIASIHADQSLVLRDRSKDLIKSGGEWISSVLLENEICAMKGVDKAAVIGVKHPKFQERPVAVIEMKAKEKGNGKGDGKGDEKEKEEVVQQPTLEEVKAHLMSTGKVAKFQLPDDVIFDKIPLTGTGKMNKKEIRAKLEEQKYVLPEFRTELKVNKRPKDDKE